MTPNPPPAAQVESAVNSMEGLAARTLSDVLAVLGWTLGDGDAVAFAKAQLASIRADERRKVLEAVAEHLVVPTGGLRGIGSFVCGECGAQDTQRSSMPHRDICWLGSLAKGPA